MAKGAALHGRLDRNDKIAAQKHRLGLKAMLDETYDVCCNSEERTGACCMTDMITNPLPHINKVLEFEKQQDCEAEGKCAAPVHPGVPRLRLDYNNIDISTAQRSLSSFKSKALWPAWISHTKLDIGKAFHDKLSGLAIAKYERFTLQMMKQSHGKARRMEINNEFYSHQIKREDVARHPAGSKAVQWWPEMYRSGEWKALFKFAKEACIRHVLRHGRNQTRAYLEKQSMSVWAAVYTTGTSHSTHMHEQALCSGVYYSNAPADSVPLILTDPRGGQPMHTDVSQEEGEPESPFMHQVSFFPQQGDMIMFPSFLPHSVPAATENTEPRVAWGFNLESIDGESYARVSGVDA
jgi:hypothetical protein